MEKIFIKSFKTKMGCGSYAKTIYALTKEGIVIVERRIVSTKLNDGFVLIRKFGNYYYQYERMLFKYDSFAEIVYDVFNNSHLLKSKDIIRQNESIKHH